MVALNFNAAQHEPRYGGGGQLPPGTYKVVISLTEAKPTKAGDGNMLVLELRVVDGSQAGNTQADRLNLFNQNAQTVQIANNQLAAYLAVCGVREIVDTDQLLNIPFQIEIGPQKDAQYTEIKKLMDLQGNGPDKAGQGAKSPVAQVAPPVAPPQGFGPSNPLPTQQFAQQPQMGAAAPWPTQPTQPLQQGFQAGATPPWGAPPQ